MPGETGDLSVIPITADDIDQLEAILLEHVRDRDSGEIVYEEIESIKSYMRGEKDQNGRTRTFFVAKDDSGKVLGCMGYSEPDSDMIAHFKTNAYESVELLNAFVSSEVFRGRGIGRKLFDAICEAARREGKTQLIVHSGPRYKASWGFYDKVCDQSCGFIMEKYGPGGDAKTWKKAL